MKKLRFRGVKSPAQDDGIQKQRREHLNSEEPGFRAVAPNTMCSSLAFPLPNPWPSCAAKKNMRRKAAELADKNHGGRNSLDPEDF